MSDRTHNRDDSTRTTDETPAKQAPATDRATRTGAGQEAAKGAAPEQHDDEPQSNYGGGGENGGSATNK